MLSETTGYLTKNAKVFAAYLPITLSTSWSYATSLALIQLNNLPSVPSTGSSALEVIYDDTFVLFLPSSTQTLYTNGSFHHGLDSSPPSMTSAWLALDDDRFILDSSSLSIPSCFPLALQSEIFAIIFRLLALSPGSSKPNHLLWLSIRRFLLNLNLKVILVKVPAYSNNALNEQVDFLAKAAHLSPQPTFSSLAFSDAHNLLSFCSLARFTAFDPPVLFDWAEIHFCLSSIKGFASHKNGHLEFWIFCIKLLLDMLPTLTTLQQHKPYLYSSNWLYPQCNSALKDLNHL
ncbi:hypothetical protein RhiirA5_429919 [Rhizophagus irregularis]|uniref:RNase H type-1 domain-containing protein n=1 Tax=Rhizophagus irregularis TaxID=588596 RepID=A0A2N0NXM0_9GLOM|nr:hypothetical protein RhiirA5_429919 [Rhizophagus irregularis]